MFPENFDYVRAGSLTEAISLLGREDAKLLAGGHSLLPLLKQRLAAPSVLVDISRLDEMKGVSVAGDRVRVGALTTHRQLAASEVLQRSAPLFSEAASKIGDPQVRNRGTLGGNIAHADPASDLPAVLLALQAQVHIQGPKGERVRPAHGFFNSLMETDLGDDEILVAVSFTALAPGDGSAYVKYEHPASGYAICGAAAVVRAGGATDLAFNGVSSVPYGANAESQALSGSDLSDGAIDSALADMSPDDLMSDIHASADYRAHLARVFGARAVRAARDRRS